MIRVQDKSHRKPEWSIRFLRGKDEGFFWWNRWTPPWHDGRGPYISIGLGLIAIYRGY